MTFVPQQGPRPGHSVVDGFNEGILIHTFVHVERKAFGKRNDLMTFSGVTQPDEPRNDQFISTPQESDH